MRSRQIESGTEVRGQGLHSAAPSAVRFERREGPSAVRAGSVVLPLADLVVADTTRSTTLASRDGRVRIGTVEHVFAALSGLGAHTGVLVTFEGPEAPLADGGAACFCDALAAVARKDVRADPPLLVVRDGEIVVGSSAYLFEKGGSIRVEVDVDFGDERLARGARWNGDAKDFRARIATARTFGFEREIADLLTRGLASHVSPESVVLIGAQRIFSAGAPFFADEPARHKLLDLLGDMFLYGGPPRGTVRAHRPGHAATHEAMQRALCDGIIAT
ncbi:MAG: UDP-3-O-acyl-N-acetylglucosamine deacetylase [Polyangiaceae bacterium]|nr:UDP-3-O-acyl-N-acetylglucosamine deacetylase [Polyangiaceae bacterium]